MKEQNQIPVSQIMNMLTFSPSSAVTLNKGRDFNLGFLRTSILYDVTILGSALEEEEVDINVPNFLDNYC